MPPKRLTTGVLSKRKRDASTGAKQPSSSTRADDIEDSIPAKRTRSSGVAPLHVPIDGAPDPPTLKSRPNNPSISETRRPSQKIRVFKEDLEEEPDLEVGKVEPPRARQSSIKGTKKPSKGSNIPMSRSMANGSKSKAKANPHITSPRPSDTEDEVPIQTSPSKKSKTAASSSKATSKRKRDLPPPDIVTDDEFESTSVILEGVESSPPPSSRKLKASPKKRHGPHRSLIPRPAQTRSPSPQPLPTTPNPARIHDVFPTPTPQSPAGRRLLAEVVINSPHTAKKASPMKALALSTQKDAGPSFTPAPNRRVPVDSDDSEADDADDDEDVLLLKATPRPKKTPTARAKPATARDTKGKARADSLIISPVKRGRSSILFPPSSTKGRSDPSLLGDEPSEGTSDTSGASDNDLPSPTRHKTPRASMGSPRKRHKVVPSSKPAAEDTEDDYDDDVENRTPRAGSSSRPHTTRPERDPFADPFTDPRAEAHSASLHSSPFQVFSPVTASPTRPVVTSATSSPTKAKVVLPTPLPPAFHPFLEAQKRACLEAFSHPPLLSSLSSDLGEDEQQASKPDKAVEALTALLKGTVGRGEGNSCLMLGPRGAGKTRIVGEALAKLSVDQDDGDESTQPIVIWLSGHAHTNDKLAMKEIGRQLVLQTGSVNLGLPDYDDDEEAEDVLARGDEDEESGEANFVNVSSIVPAAAHLPMLITTMSSLPRPTIVILDGFDLFMGHARQALLYCLLDTVQSCRAGEGRKGVAVVGVSSRVDCLNLLEKRVKSRFSHRIIKCSPPTNVPQFVSLAKAMLEVPLAPQDSDADQWSTMWNQSVDTTFSTKLVQRVMKETFELVRDVGLLTRILIPVILQLQPSSPWLNPSKIKASADSQRAPPRFPFLGNLSYPSLALLVAAHHIQTSGHEAFTFEHLFDSFSRAARDSANVNVSLNGVGVGLQKVGREVMFSAFEELINMRVMQPSGSTSTNTTRQFVKYRTEAPREDVKAVVDKRNITQLKRWLARAGQ